ncbi:MAG: hypothetical protein ACK4GO_13185 [Gemmobacter sp.]
MRWEEIRAGWLAMTRRVRAEGSGFSAPNAPPVARPEAGQTAADAKAATTSADGPMR